MGGALQKPVWPDGFSLRTFEPADASDAHALTRSSMTTHTLMSAFLKDLAVDPGARRLGVGEALMWHVFSVFQAPSVVSRPILSKPGAVRLYRRLDMIEVDWEG